MKIYFIRHGESEANKLDIGAGSEYETPLTDLGREQAKKTGQKLKSKRIDLIVSSPMERTVETAKIIAKEIGYEPKKILLNPDFVERGWGIYSKRPNSEYTAAVLSDKPLHESVEPVDVMHKRVTKGLEWLSQQKAHNVVLISHGGVSRILRMIHQNLPHSHMYKMDRLPNAEIYEFEL